MSDEGWIAAAEEELGTGAGRAALPFLEAVATQLGAPLVPGGRDRSPAREREAALRAARVLRTATAPPCEGGGQDAAALLLGVDPGLLAAFFGNMDLLFESGFPGADEVGTAVVQAAWAAGRGEPG